jgi:hypothetical protein
MYIAEYMPSAIQKVYMSHATHSSWAIFNTVFSRGELNR